MSNRDITDLKNAERQAHQLAFYDVLTGLPNRRMLIDRLHQALSQAKRFRRSLAVLYLDLDLFKEVNDTHGHEAGDELLKEAAKRLVACVREGDTVARSGGDEFIIVLSEITSPSDAEVVAGKMLEALRAPVQCGDIAVNVTASIGIAVHPVDGDGSAPDLMSRADKAMYDVKRTIRDAYRVSLTR